MTNRTIQRKRIFTALWLPILGLPLATAQAACTLEQLSWLSGEWQASMGKSTVLERWQAISADSFEGESQTIAADGKVKQQESLRLVQMQQQIFYLAKVSHNPLPVAFKLEACEAGRLKFVNMAHDFPKQLEYVLKPVETSAGSEADLSNLQPQLQVNVSDGAGKGFSLLFLKKR